MVRKVSRNSIAVTVLAGIVLVLFVATVAGLLYYRKMIKDLNEVQEEVYEEYTRLYAYIAEDPASKLSNKIYKAFCKYVFPPPDMKNRGPRNCGPRKRDVYFE